MTVFKIKGTPIPFREARQYSPLRTLAAKGRLLSSRVCRFYIYRRGEGLELTLDDARELSAVLLQFIADAEVS